MKNVESKLCPFCKELEESKLSDEHFSQKRKGRLGETEYKYSVTLVHETYYNGFYCGRSTRYNGPLNYCPVCGIKIEKE